MYNDYGEILTVEQLAELLQIGLSTTYKLLRENEISSFRINNSYRIERSSVTDYIMKKSSRPSSK